MSAYDDLGTSSSDSYGTDANFQANYRPTAAFLAAHAARSRPATGSGSAGTRSSGKTWLTMTHC
jgi:hypothetical protein